jgi:Protein of unknown function (DUF3177)
MSYTRNRNRYLPIFPSLTMSNPPWFQSLIWLDYRLAVMFTVTVPMVLLIWAFVKKVPVAMATMTIYWRVASLLGISFCLMFGASSLSFFTALAAKILIPLSLWFWIDINDEINDLPPKPIKLALTVWRWAVTIYSLVGAIALVPFIQCGISSSLLKSDYCQAWFHPPLLDKRIFVANGGTLGGLGIAALVFYGLCFGYFLVVRLGKQGRIAMELND